MLDFVTQFLGLDITSYPPALIWLTVALFGFLIVDSFFSFFAVMISALFRRR